MKEKSVMEKHIQTILVSIITGLAIWIGISVNNQGLSIAMLTERVASLQGQIKNNPSVSRDEVIQFLDVHNQRFRGIEEKINRNESRLDRIEKDLYVSYPNPNRRVSE